LIRKSPYPQPKGICSLMALTGAGSSHVPAAAFTCDAADFDGTNDNWIRGGDLTGIADGKQGTFYGWIRLDGGNGVAQVILALRLNAEANNGFQVFRTAANKLRVHGQNTAGTNVLDFLTTPTYVAGATQISILASWDLAAGVGQLYVNDAAPALDVNTLTNDNIDYTRGNVGVGGLTNNTLRLNACAAELFFHTIYIDLSVTANRRKFINAAGKPVYLGADGSIPLGVQPLLYFHLDDGETANNFVTNRGSGGAGTLTGTLATCSTSPSD
jgi:hypothetical protein